MEPEKIEIRLTLTIDDCKNLVAFGNRAQMSGAEADLWVSLKHRLLRQVDDQVNRREAKQDGAALEVVKKDL